MSNGLGHLMFELRRNIIKTTLEQKGDWKPIIFLFTDGVPTDNSKNAIHEWKQNWQRTANMIAISFGDNTDTSLLGELTDNVLQFNNATSDDYQKFFKWVTDSIKTNSVRVENSTSGFELAKLDDNTLTKIDHSQVKTVPSQYLDNNFVVLAGRCQNTKRPYLIKYKKALSNSSTFGFNYQTLSYNLVGAFQVDDSSYSELSDRNGITARINTEELIGVPSCPCCGNQYAFAMCGCGELHCFGLQNIDEKTSEMKATCPSCGVNGNYGSGNGGF